MAAALGGVVIAQEKPAAPAAASADTADVLGPAFEVATVRLGHHNDGGFRLSPSGRLTVQSVPLTYLVQAAYGGKVEGGPAWASSDSDTYDITAKVDDAQMADWDKLTDRERANRVLPMLRTLLAERFKLKVHAENKTTAVYAVTQAKGGAKVKEVPPPVPLEGEGDAMERMQRWMKEHPGQPVAGRFTCTEKGCSGSAVLMETIVRQVGGEARLDAMTVDETGLKGFYDFSYTISRDKDAPPIVEQMEEQLGLRFEPRKVPIKTFVIDAAERPSEN
jgi:bla regulator protein blaR1